MGWLWIVTACSIRVLCRTALATPLLLPPLTEKGHLLDKINRANEIELIGHSNQGLGGESLDREVSPHSLTILTTESLHISVRS